MTVGENIKRLRKERGLTQKKLGELCGINEANIRKYENGKQNPKIETIDRIAFALEVDIVDILDELLFKPKTNELGHTEIQDKQCTSIQPNSIPMTEQEKQLITSFRELDGQKQDYILLTLAMVKNIP